MNELQGQSGGSIVYASIEVEDVEDIQYTGKFINNEMLNFTPKHVAICLQLYIP